MSSMRRRRPKLCDDDDVDATATPRLLIFPRMCSSVTRHDSVYALLCAMLCSLSTYMYKSVQHRAPSHAQRPRPDARSASLCRWPSLSQFLSLCALVGPERHSMWAFFSMRTHERIARITHTHTHERTSATKCAQALRTVPMGTSVRARASACAFGSSSRERRALRLRKLLHQPSI